MQCDENKGNNDIANHSKEYHHGRRESTGITKNKKTGEAVTLLTIQSNINRGEGNQ